MKENAKPILIIGGGIGGITAAVEAAEVGYRVILVEKEPYLGGRVIRTYQYFPKMCPPTCGFEINLRRLRKNPRIAIHTFSTVENISGQAGDFKVKIRTKPRYVTDTYTFDSSIPDQLESERSNDFNLGMDKTKALYLPHDMAYPPGYVLDKEALSDTDKAKLSEICKEGEIDLEMKEKEISVDVGAIIVTTGWRPYDAAKLDTLGFGQCQNVITNVMMERLASGGGPTGGEILRPSDGNKAENVAFVQCAGSRDENHLPYCSAVCCMGSLKQANYIREKNENSKVTIFYIDIRTIGRLEKFYYNLTEDENVSFIKGKVAKISEDDNKYLILDVEDTVKGENLHKGFDLVVLATGVVPNTSNGEIPFDVKCDDYGFIDEAGIPDGIYAAGCVKSPCDVSHTTKEATAAALKAIQCINKGGE
jgi:quinone-modifying oxidoreductase subunit QmoA